MLNGRLPQFRTTVSARCDRTCFCAQESLPTIYEELKPHPISAREVRWLPTFLARTRRTLNGPPAAKGLCAAHDNYKSGGPGCVSNRALGSDHVMQTCHPAKNGASNDADRTPNRRPA